MAAPCAAPLGARCAAPARLRQAGALRRAACRSLGATTVNTSGAPPRMHRLRPALTQHASHACRALPPSDGARRRRRRRCASPGRRAASPCRRRRCSAAWGQHVHAAPWWRDVHAASAVWPGRRAAVARGRPPLRAPRPGAAAAADERVHPVRPVAQRSASSSAQGSRVCAPCSVPNVRLVDADKEMLGVFTREEALKKAEAAGLDLVRYSALSLQGIGLGRKRRGRAHACAAPLCAR